MAKKDEGAQTVRIGADGRAVVEQWADDADLAPTPAVVKGTKTQARAAANMRIAGAGYDDIARVLNYTDAASARKVVEETIAAAFPDESREALRRLTGARLQDLMRKIAPKTDAMVPVLDDFGQPVMEGGKVLRTENPEQLSHVKVMADLVMRHARLHGLESIEVQVSPDAERYEQVLRAALTQARSAGPKEADPFDEEYLDAEVVTDDADA